MSSQRLHRLMLAATKIVGSLTAPNVASGFAISTMGCIELIVFCNSRVAAKVWALPAELMMRALDFLPESSAQRWVVQ
jgi:hypothetical protein